MARINVEEKVWEDSRFRRLVTIFGDESIAIGCMVRFWHLSQKEFLKSDQYASRIDLEYFRIPVAQIIEAGLAEDRGGFIYPVGAGDQFTWLATKKESGRRGGKARVRGALRKNESVLGALAGDYVSSKAVCLPKQPRVLGEALLQNTTENDDQISSKPVCLPKQGRLLGEALDDISRPQISQSADYVSSKPVCLGKQSRVLGEAKALASKPLIINNNNYNYKNTNTSFAQELIIEEPPVAGALTAQKLVSLWNEQNGGMFPKVNQGRLSPGRIRKINTQIKNDPDEETWTDVFKKMRESNFLNGSSTSWRASFDWMLSMENRNKIIEGHYENREKQAAPERKIKKLSEYEDDEY
jgi:hypothetical protein